jgi:dipeptidyl aminopeptidase/acylaminoacyl peptidase
VHEPKRRRGCLRRVLIFGTAGVVVLVVVAAVGLWVLDRRLNPPVDAPELEPVELPSGPALEEGRVVFDSDATDTFEIYAMSSTGEDIVQLTDDARFDSWWARPSPDGTTILFYRTPAGVHDRDFTATSLWAMAADGTGQVELLPPGSHGWNQHGHAEWSPDGNQLVMFGGKNSNPQIWVTDATGRNPRRVAGDAGTNVDPSWSPDGDTIVYAGCPERVCFPDDQEVYIVAADGAGDRQRLTSDDVRDNDPYFSPDGARIAMLSQTSAANGERVAGSWNIRMIPAEGGVEASLVTDDLEVNSMPKWLDGELIYFHRLEYGAKRGFDVFTVNVADGELTPIRATQANEEYPAPVVR